MYDLNMSVQVYMSNYPALQHGQIHHQYEKLHSAERPRVAFPSLQLGLKHWGTLLVT